MTVRILRGDVRDMLKTLPSDSVDLAYIAGLLDGEAYIGIKKAKAYPCQGRVTAAYHARIQIRMTAEEAIKFIAEKLGGWYYPEKKAQVPGRKLLYCYQASDARAETIIRSVLPFLLVKKEVAKTVLELRDLQRSGKEYKTKITGVRAFQHWTGKVIQLNNLAFSDEYVELCDTLYRKAKALNAVGTRGREGV